MNISFNLSKNAEELLQEIWDLGFSGIAIGCYIWKAVEISGGRTVIHGLVKQECSRTSFSAVQEVLT